MFPQVVIIHRVNLHVLNWKRAEWRRKQTLRLALRLCHGLRVRRVLRVFRVFVQHVRFWDSWTLGICDSETLGLRVSGDLGPWDSGSKRIFPNRRAIRMSNQFQS